jgi:hypothetical protein
MSKTAFENVLVQGEQNRMERDAGGTITPGDLVALASDNEVDRQNSADAAAALLFALENDIGGDDLDHDYAAGEVVQIHRAKSGDIIFAWLADGMDVDIGDFLSAAAGGSLGELNTAGDNPLAMALEAVDTSDSAAARSRILVMIL